MINKLRTKSQGPACLMGAVMLSFMVTIVTLCINADIVVSTAHAAATIATPPALSRRALESADELRDYTRDLVKAWDDELDENQDRYSRRERRELGTEIERIDIVTRRLYSNIRDGKPDGRARSDANELSRRAEIVDRLVRRLRPSRYFEDEWRRARRAIDDTVSDVNYGASDRVSSSDRGSSGGGVSIGVADKIEDLSERTKNEFRAHVKRHPEIKGKAWRKKLDGLLSGFDQVANTLQKRAHKGGGGAPARDLQNRAAAIRPLIANRPAGKKTRQHWNALDRLLDKL